MADISTGRQRGIVPFVDETTGRLPDQYLPQGVIDLQGDLKQAVTNAADSATAAQNAVDGFGLTVGTTTTGEPGSDAAVEIQKNGTRYTANFTIPRGDKGEQASVEHDGTLTGDGTSGTPLGAAIGSALNQGETYSSSELDLNTYISPGIYGIAGTVVQNAPTETAGENKFMRAALLVSGCGYSSTDKAILQVLFTRNESREALGIYIRGLRANVWDEWKRMASMSDIPTNVSALTSRITTLQAGLDELAVMQTRVEALEARIKSLETN